MAFPKASGSRPSMLRRQQLLAEFSGLKQACPDGIYATLASGDPASWSGVLFVRCGPYAGAVMRFTMVFPAAYPRALPLVTFTTEMFHPLIAPLTTYTTTTSSDKQESTVSANDDEKLSPGAFNMRHGFPQYFARTARTGPPEPATPKNKKDAKTRPYLETKRRDVSVYEVLQYIKSAFDSEELLDDVPLEAAGDKNAWRAWRERSRGRPASTRISVGSSIDAASTIDPGEKAKYKEKEEEAKGKDEAGEAKGKAKEGGNAETAEATDPKAKAPTIVETVLEVPKEVTDPDKELPPTPAPPSPPPRDPNDWNWSGVWNARVSKAIVASCSEAVLYGGNGLSDDAMHFLPLDETDTETAKANLRRTLGMPS